MTWHRRSTRRRRAVWYSIARFLRPSKVPRESHLRSRSWTLRTACRQAGQQYRAGLRGELAGCSWQPGRSHNGGEKKVLLRDHAATQPLGVQRSGTQPWPAHGAVLGLCVLTFGLGVLTMFGLPPRRLPLADLAETFRLLAVALIPAPRLVGASAAFAHATPRTRSAPSGRAVGLSLNVEGAHGRIELPREKLGEDVSAFSPGAFKSPTRQSPTSLKSWKETRQRAKPIQRCALEEDMSIEARPMALSECSETALISRSVPGNGSDSLMFERLHLPSHSNALLDIVSGVSLHPAM